MSGGGGLLERSASGRFEALAEAMRGLVRRALHGLMARR
jgi:hypothetical protein